VTVEVHVVTPDREVWSGKADSVIARGVDGEVGILAGHAPLLIRLAIGPLRLLGAESGPEIDAPEIDAVVDGGFMHVTSSGMVTRVDVMATGAAMRAEIDMALVQARADELRAELDGRDSNLAEADIEATRTELQKALARLELAG
jgi:ATP synthase, F1 epsilon subunit (delta in mitochondria)